MNDFEKIYDEFMETDGETASDEVRNEYGTMHDAFENYLCAIQEDLFRKVYKFGFERGMAAGKEGAVK